jgi:hypothetical protein
VGAAPAAGQWPGGSAAAGDLAGAGDRWTGVGVRGMVRICAIALLGLTCVGAGLAQEADGETLLSAPMCQLSHVESKASAAIRCFPSPVDLEFDEEVPTRLSLPMPKGNEKTGYLLQPISSGQREIDWVFVRLTMALAACDKDRACRDLAPELLEVSAFGCSERPMAFQPRSIFHWDGEDTPMFASGSVFLCRGAAGLLLVYVSPLSGTLREGLVPDRVFMDSFQLAVLPLSN